MTDTDDADFVLAFLLLEKPELPAPDAVCAAAATLGLTLSIDPETASPGSEVQFYDGPDGRVLMLMLVDRPHPDAGEMCYGITSPDAEAAAAAPAHVIATTMGSGDSVREKDLHAARLAAAVARGADCVGVMLGHGAAFHQPDYFCDIDPGCTPATLPLLSCIDLTVGQESETELSVLTHGMPRYGREDLRVYASHEQGNEAIDFAMGIANWMLCDPDKELPTGDTIGRDEDEKILVERGPSPVDESQTVMVLRLPS